MTPPAPELLPRYASREDACKAIQKIQLAVAKGTVFESFRDSTGDEGVDDRTEQLGTLTPGKCYEAGTSAWAFVVTQVHQLIEERAGCGALVHIDADGNVARAYPGAGTSDDTCDAETESGGNLLQGQYFANGTYGAPVLFDFDGDGEPEIFIAERGMRMTQSVDDRGAIFTYRAGRVERYFPTKDVGVTALVDVDHDGRPDILTHASMMRTVGVGHCGEGGLHFMTVWGPRFVGHSLADGTFSFEDAVAKRALAKACAKSSTATIEDEVAMGCALAKGMSVATVEKRLPACRPNCGGETPCCPDWCVTSKGEVEDFAKTPPPTTLP